MTRESIPFMSKKEIIKDAERLEREEKIRAGEEEDPNLKKEDKLVASPTIVHEECFIEKNEK